MQKIVFEDAPSTNTPLSSSNLNLLQTNIEDAYEPDILTAKLSSNYTLTADNTYETVTLSQYDKEGTKLSVSNGGVLIGSGVTKVKVSASARFGTITASGLKYIVVNKNESSNVCQASVTGTASERNELKVPSALVSVTSGDIIYLRVYGKTGDIINTTSSTLITYLTVEVVK